ncbi:MAG: FkbM family methyltransferase [Gaiellaceae bacterium]
MRRLVRRKPDLIVLAVPGSDHSVVARPGTSDRAAFDQVFGGAYALDLPVEPRLIFDLGANVGYASVGFALRYRRARIVAVEPEPSNVTILRRNVASFDRVDVVEGAVWPRSETLVLEDPGKGHWGMRVSAGGVKGSVLGVTISELLVCSEAEFVDLVKVDIEGSELELFSAETGWLQRVGALVVELHDRFRSGCEETVERAIVQSGIRFRKLRYGADVLYIRDDQPQREAGARRSTTQTS